jgi:hypothetical protein
MFKNKSFSVVPGAVLLVVLAATVSQACAQSAPEAPAEDTATITVRSAKQLAPVAPAWQPDRTYKYGDLVSYDGVVFQAKSGSAHHRPDAARQVGWERLNDCGDKSKGAIKCEIGNQVEAVPVAEQEKRRDDNIRAIEFGSGSSMHN